MSKQNYGCAIYQEPIDIPVEMVVLGAISKSCRDTCKIVVDRHWNGNVLILMTFSSPAALEVVKLTTSSAVSDENIIKITTFVFQFRIHYFWSKNNVDFFLSRFGLWAHKSCVDPVPFHNDFRNRKWNQVYFYSNISHKWSINREHFEEKSSDKVVEIIQIHFRIWSTKCWQFFRPRYI